MSKQLSPQNVSTYLALTPATDAAGRTSAYYSLKNAKRAWAVFAIAQGNAATVECSLEQATAVAGTGAKGLDTNHRIWASNDTAVTKDPAAQTAAAGFTTDAALKNKLVIIEIDPNTLDVAGGYDCVALTTGASNVANLTSAFLMIEQVYQQSAPPTATAN